MKSFFDRKRILSLVFLLYFSVYASSPLLSFRDGQMSLRGCDEADSPSGYSKNFHIYLYDLICSNLFPRNNAGVPKAAAGVILLKKRAVLSDETAKLIRLSDASGQDNNPPFLNYYVTVLLPSRPSIISAWIPSNLYPGLSPPQAV
jgi:hypothetical protein